MAQYTEETQIPINITPVQIDVLYYGLSNPIFVSIVLKVIRQ